MTMKRRFIASLLTVALTLMSACNAYAYERKEHDRIMDEVLFGNPSYSKTLPSGKHPAMSLEVLKCASYLCIDQFQGNGADELNKLEQYGVDDLPKKIEDIDFSSNSKHRVYTHRGWNPVNPVQFEKWPVRKKILCNTVNEVFDFDNPGQCDAMSALIYYIHLLGDLESIKSLDSYTSGGSAVLPLARAHADENSPDILYELTEIYLPRLFSNQIDSPYYKSLISSLEAVASMARMLADNQGGINTEEKFNTYHSYVDETLRILRNYIPKLLREESFFNSVFPN